MIVYITKRILLLAPTLLAVIGINFIVLQFAPGGPIDTIAAQMRQQQTAARPSTAGGVPNGAETLDPATIAKLNQQFGLDKPPLSRFVSMLKDDVTFNFGTSFFQGQPVLTLIRERLPVSLSLGLWSTLMVYLIAIPLGIGKAVRNGSRFDLITSLLLLAGFAIPGFLLAILLLGLFGAGGEVPLFPLSGLATPGASAWPWPAQLADTAWHLVLPTIAMTAGGLASLTMLTKNALLEEFGKLYVTAVRARGIGESRILYMHIFRNAMLVIAAGLPATFTAILFTSALLVEIIFSVNGLGLLGYNAVVQRDYPVMFATLYIYTLTGLLMQLAGDVLYTFIDPRIDFEGR